MQIRPYQPIDRHIAEYKIKRQSCHDSQDCLFCIILKIKYFFSLYFNFGSQSAIHLPDISIITDAVTPMVVMTPLIKKINIIRLLFALQYIKNSPVIKAINIAFAV